MASSNNVTLPQSCTVYEPAIGAVSLNSVSKKTLNYLIISQILLISFLNLLA